MFVDFKQAYDSINREKLYTIMLNMNIPPKLVRLVRTTMLNTLCSVKINGELTEQFEVSQGLKQGDGLAPMLFNLSLEHVVRSTPVNVNSTLLNK